MVDLGGFKGSMEPPYDSYLYENQILLNKILRTGKLVCMSDILTTKSAKIIKFVCVYTHMVFFTIFSG